MTLFLKIGTRASPLARQQTSLFCTFLQKSLPDLRYEIVDIVTQGDQIQDRPLYEIGGKGLFIKELDQALLQGTIDIAVHSAKDLESYLHSEIAIACVLPRADRHDVLISHQAQNLQQLREGARVGTSSPRRQAQLLMNRPDLEIVPIRGSVQTRLKKLDEQKLDGIILAKAGLERLGLEQGAIIPPELMLPSAGQGIIAATIHGENHPLYHQLYPLSHQPSLDELYAERALLRTLEGSCRTAIGVWSHFQARTANDERRQMPPNSRMSAEIIHPRGHEHVRKNHHGTQTPEQLGTELGKMLKTEAAHLLALQADSGSESSPSSTP